MVNTRKKEQTESITIRVTPGEKRATTELAAKLAADMEAKNIPGDASIATYLRHLIRREAREAGISIADDAPAPKGRATKGGRP